MFCGNRSDYTGPSCNSPGDDLRFGAAERERDHRGPLARHELELRSPPVVTPARFTERNARPLCFRDERFGVGADCLFVCLEPCREKDVDAKRPLRRRPHLGDLPRHLGDRLVAGGDKAEAARLGNCCGKFRRRRPAGQRRAHDRNPQRKSRQSSRHPRADYDLERRSPSRRRRSPSGTSRGAVSAWAISGPETGEHGRRCRRPIATEPVRSSGCRL